MVTTLLLQTNARHAARFHINIDLCDVKVELSSARGSHCASEEAADGVSRAAATRATLALFSRGGVVDARAFSF